MRFSSIETHARYNARHPGRRDELLAVIQQRNMAINRPYLLQYKQTHPCIECGEARIDCLVFHHLGDKEKDKEVGKFLRNSHHLLVAEVEKCVMLCANCHQILHANQRRGISIHQWREMQPGHDDSPKYNPQLTFDDLSTYKEEL